MSSEHIRSAIHPYLSNQLDVGERAAFEQHLAHDPDLRAEVDELREIWEGLGSLPVQQPGASLRARFYRRLEQAGEKPTPARRWWMPGWSSGFAPQAAGALALFLIGFYVRGSIQNESGAQIAQLHLEIRNMREMLAVSLLDRQSASARLEGIAWGRRVDHPDQQVASALLTALNHDSNVNVRLSSVDALQSLAADPSIRRALVDSVSTQESPLVQIALIDALVQLRDEDATAELRKVVSDPQYEKSVRGHAGWALRQIHNR